MPTDSIALCFRGQKDFLLESLLPHVRSRSLPVKRVEPNERCFHNLPPTLNKSWEHHTERMSSWLCNVCVGRLETYSIFRAAGLVH